MMVATMSIENLDAHHRHALRQSIRNVLTTEIAEETMAQLLDGMPKWSEARKIPYFPIHEWHPLQYHQEICPHMVSKIRESREEYVLRTVHFKPETLEAYQREVIGSRGFHMRLIELTVISIHEIAVAISCQQPKGHTKEYINHVTGWMRPERWKEPLEDRYWEESAFGPLPTLFYHYAYSDHDIYPNGIADIAGYWAESQIFGGVVVFDRGQSGHECRDVFLHCGKFNTSPRLWRPTTLQFNSWINLLLKGIVTGEKPLPLMVTDDNNYRIHDWDAIALQHIFRDPWERRVPGEKPETRDVADGECWFVGDPSDNHPGAVRDFTPADPWIFEMGGHKGRPLGIKYIQLGGPPGSKMRRHALECLAEAEASP